MRFVIALLAVLSWIASVAAPETPRIRIAVMDIELTGDLGDPGLEEAHEARVRMASDVLRERLARTDRFEIADNARASDLIARYSSVQYLHKCNGCELDIARALGAERILVAWVHRVSNLILTLNYEIRDADSGKTLAKRAYSFRGDNDASWTRAVD